MVQCAARDLDGVRRVRGGPSWVRHNPSPGGRRGLDGETADVDSMCCWTGSWCPEEGSSVFNVVLFVFNVCCRTITMGAAPPGEQLSSGGTRRTTRPAEERPLRAAPTKRATQTREGATQASYSNETGQGDPPPGDETVRKAKSKTDF